MTRSLAAATTKNGGDAGTAAANALLEREGCALCSCDPTLPRSSVPRSDGVCHPDPSRDSTQRDLLSTSWGAIWNMPCNS